MSTQMTVRESRKLERETKLAELAEVANRAHDVVVEAAREAVMRALEAGRALVTAHDLCPKGTWTAWLADKFEGSPSTAHDYMRVAQYVAELGDDPQCVAGLSFNEVKRLIAGRKPARRKSDGKAPAALVVRSQRSTAGHGGEIGPNAAGQPLGTVGRPAPTPETGEEVPASETGDAAAVPTPVDGSDRLDPFVQMLKQAVAELRRLVQEGADDASYARHLLPPLERICGGVATRLWFWDLTER